MYRVGDRQQSARAWWIGLCRLVRERHGGVVLTVAIALPALLGAAGLAVDLGQWYRERATLQTAADAAALGAARLLSDSSATQNDYQAVALAEAEGAIGAGTVGTLANQITVAVVSGTSVSVTLTSTANQYFTSVLPIAAPILSATAKAGKPQPPPCLLALNNTSSTGISIVGNANISAPGCTIFSNSTSADSIDVNLTGNVTINAGEVGSSGITQETGNVSVTPPPLNDQPSLPDPYAELTPPTPGTCYSGPSSYSSNQTVILNPGTYCSGLSFTGNETITFNPGTYILEGNFALTGNVTIASADGVTFYLGGGASTASIQWTGNVITQTPMTAPTTGPYAGVLVYQSRSASLGNAASITGNASFQMGGAVYMPKAALSITGNAYAAPPAGSGFSAIANTISVAGNPTFSTGSGPGGGNSSAVVLLQ